MEKDSGWEVREGGGKVSRVLSLSYNDLPLHLMSCFLYCCLFPEDHLIKKNKLLRLWVAQGFVENKDGKVIEDVTAEHISSCRVHDVVQEFAIPIAKEELSGEFYGGVGDFDPSQGARLFFIVGNPWKILQNRDYLRVQTLSYLKPLTYHLRNLRVLHVDVFRSVSRQQIELRDVSVHLRYIGIHKRFVSVVAVEIKLPEKLPKLQELQYANVICGYGENSVQPKAIKSLQNLRTLGLIN
ncbi:hypothetical protein AMTRI_Chr10g233150 [Amborella trichopoda]